MSLYDRFLAFTGIIPPFLLLWLAESFERRVLEPTQGFRYRVFAAAGLATIPIAWAERLVAYLGGEVMGLRAGLFDAYVVSASVEEIGKVACLMALTRGALAPRTRYGAFLYSLHAAMGFALVENVIAMLKTPDLLAFSNRYFLRAYFSVPAHLVATGMLGFLWARRRFDRGPVGLAGGLGVAIGIHGTFNALLYAIDHLPDEQDTLRTACAMIAIAIPLAGVVALRLLSARLRADDRRDTATMGRRTPTEPPNSVAT